jgi:enolase-phosphatase E1
MVQAVLTDIEGTTSSLFFVKDVLFPYARERIADFVHERSSDPLVAGLLEQARAEAGGNLDQEALIDRLQVWIDEDRKVTPLKALQGLIWEDGFKRRDFIGHVYEDAVHCLQAWRAKGIALYVYSSGSVHAQRLLFGHTDYGDLTPLFSGYFDTKVGHKREVQSYRTIADDMGLPAQEVLFLSDIREELDAAREAGMQTVWLVREGDLDPASPHVQVRDFVAINI